MYKTVIFDFFEVIHQDPLEILLRKYGHTREGRVAEVCLKLDLGQIDYQIYLELLAQFFGMTVADFTEEMAACAELDTDVAHLIKQLKLDGYQTALLSNTHSEEIQPILDRHKLHELFDEIVISAEVGMAKPDPQIFNLVLERLGVQPERAIFTDDNPKNVAAAGSVGITGICFTGAHALRNDLQGLGLTAK